MVLISAFCTRISDLKETISETTTAISFLFFKPSFETNCEFTTTNRIKNACCFLAVFVDFVFVDFLLLLWLPLIFPMSSNYMKAMRFITQAKLHQICIQLKTNKIFRENAFKTSQNDFMRNHKSKL